jgi:succinyl-CoA:acetate CoA-transferase
MLEDRIANAALRGKVAPAEEAARIIRSGMTVAMGGYTACGYPKVIASELAARKKGGEDLKISLIAGAQLGQDVYEELGRAGVLERYAPLIGSQTMTRLANSGGLHYVEVPMNRISRLLRSGALGRVNVAVVEAAGITSEGHLIPANSLGMVPNFLEAAEAVIVELNQTLPEALDGLHDSFLPLPHPHTRPIPLVDVRQRIGVPHLAVDPGKIKYVVASDRPDFIPEAEKKNDLTAITDNLLNVLELESKKNWNNSLRPLQTGFGNLTEAILAALGVSGFRDLEFFCGGVVDAHLELLRAGKARAVSTGSLQLGPLTRAILETDPALCREHLVIRNTEQTNHAETIGRLGLIALNSGLEVDIYGNVNSSHILGGKVVNGIGGGANFAQNSLLSVVIIPSLAKGGDISSIVPMVSHNDINEHDVDILVTENGVADLRGKDETERALAVIANCAHESYRDALLDYLRAAAAEYGGHHPMSPLKALSWHQRLHETGSMRP